VPASKGDTVTAADFPTILKAIQEDGARELGPSFNKPD